MHVQRWFFIIVALFGSALGNPSKADAKNTLIVLTERVVVFSGPGKFYRPLMTLRANSEIAYAPKTVETKHGSFYKVRVMLSNRKKAVGYIPVGSQVRKKSDSRRSDEFENFDDFPLANNAIQVSYAQLKSKRSLTSIGYLNYLGPGFYYKGFAGAVRAPNDTAPLVGAEFGNDGSLSKRISGFISFAGGIFIIPREDSLFPGSKKDFTNFLVQATIGARYNFKNSAALSIGGTQAVMFNNNNSSVTSGAVLTVEMGL